MNDFTKEELEILKRAMNFWVGENAGKVIKGKLQSLIDNYCEHFNQPGEVEIFVDVCLDCDSLILRTKTHREYNE